MASSYSHISKRRVIVSALLFISGISIFSLILSGVIDDNGISTLDQPIYMWMLEHRSDAATPIMEFITHLLSPTSLCIAAVIVAILWRWRTKETWRPSLLLGAMASGLLLTYIVKYLVERSRPPVFSMVPPIETDFSFPSGHAAAIALFCLIISYLLCSRHPRKRLNWIMGCFMASAALIGLLAVTRLYLGYHWFTDVSASVCLALVVLSVLIIVDSLQPKVAMQPPTKAALNNDQ